MCYIYYIHIIHIWQKQVRSKGRRTYLHLHYDADNIAYGVASVSRIDKIIGLFCKRAL